MNERQRKYEALKARGWSEQACVFLSLQDWPSVMRRKLLDEPAERGKKEHCKRCGYRGPALDRHHVHGRKNSSETVVVCANCHRELHAGEPWEKS